MNAKEMLAKTVEIAYDEAISCIEEAIKEGKTSVYLRASESCPPREVVERLLYDGYDISYSRYHYGDWFVKIYWHDNACGRVYKVEDISKYTLSSLEEMYSFEG